MRIAQQPRLFLTWRQRHAVCLCDNLGEREVRCLLAPPSTRFPTSSANAKVRRESGVFSKSGQSIFEIPPRVQANDKRVI